ncbi:hypothetical protein J2W56_005127 [Nocardia kruczakiae]|uniref:Uncharacterized protein n=1 Tax=Nocardia kruczakiae TaxID=261477 RepID=A0ABU1XLD1_9NOCA|nr:hypothetical protein [Nocardia kruczakiae]
MGSFGLDVNAGFMAAIKWIELAFGIDLGVH